MRLGLRAEGADCTRPAEILAVVTNSSARRVLLIGEGELSDATARTLESGGATVDRLHEPGDSEIREALEGQVDHVVVISRFDHLSLRRALVVAHVRPHVQQLVTVFDRDVAEHLRETVENVHVLSMADVVAPAFAGPCLDDNLLALIQGPDGVEGVCGSDDGPKRLPRSWTTPSRAQRFIAGLESLARPFDSSARILVFGLLGFLAVMAIEIVVTMMAESYSFIDAFYAVAKVTVTVGPSPAADQGEPWFKLFSAISMLLTLGFAAVLTAGIVNRLLDPRLTGIAGRSAVPRRDHVVIVGLGQVGFRLCGLLRDLGVPVIAIEQNEEAKNVPRAKDEHLPVVIGSGASQRLLRRVSIRRARALAAVTSDEVENIAIAVAARGLREDLNIALRAGDGDATTETRSLFRIGVIRDVYELAGSALAGVTLGYDASEAFPYKGTMYLADDQGAIEAFGTRQGS